MKVIRTIRLCRWRYISRPVPATGVRVSKLYERVREARSLTKLTQEALAGELGVTRSAVAQWEMAEGTAPSVDNLIGLAKRSGMTFEYLATGPRRARVRPAGVLDCRRTRPIPPPG